MVSIRYVTLSSMMTAAFLTSGCGNHQLASAKLHYITFSQSGIKSASLKAARKDWFNICLMGSVSQADFERAQLWSRRATLSWLRVLKSVDREVTSNIAFTCDDPDLTVRMRNGSGTSYAKPSWTTIYMSRPYGTWTHEFGHALAALGDTYTNGTAGKCKPGQPQSLMCWGAYGPKKDPETFSTLWLDDIEGIQSTYKVVENGELTPPSWVGQVDLEASLDPDQPWPGATALTSVDLENLDVAIIEGRGPTPIETSRNTTSIDL